MLLLLIFLFVLSAAAKTSDALSPDTLITTLRRVFFFSGARSLAWMEIIVLFILFTGKDKAVFVLCALPPLMLYLHSFLLSNKEWAIAFLFHEKGDYLWIAGLEEKALVVFFFFVCGMNRP